jgi:hypothetical protein
MPRHLKLIGFVILGLIVSIILFFVQVYAILEPIRAASGHSPESYLGIAYEVMLPLSLLIGSGLTGFFSSKHIKTILVFLLITPGLYFSLTLLIITLIHAKTTLPWFTEWLLQLEILWFFVSWAGIGIGHFIKWNIRRGIN